MQVISLIQAPHSKVHIRSHMKVLRVEEGTEYRHPLRSKTLAQQVCSLARQYPSLSNALLPIAVEESKTPLRRLPVRFDFQFPSANRSHGVPRPWLSFGLLYIRSKEYQ